MNALRVHKAWERLSWLLKRVEGRRNRFESAKYDFYYEYWGRHGLPVYAGKDKPEDLMFEMGKMYQKEFNRYHRIKNAMDRLEERLRRMND